MQREGAAGDAAASFEGAPTTVGLVCGEAMWEHAFTWLLRGAGIDVVSHVRDVDRALDVVLRSAPSVLLVDVDGEVEPPRLLRRIRDVQHARPATRVVVVCAFGDNAAHDAALAAGVDHVVWRENPLDLVRAVDGADEEAPGCDRPHLTLRELEILRLVAEGRTNREVARAAWVTEHTVKYHLANIYRRLGVRTRREATAWAVANGVVELTDAPAARP